MRTCASCGGPIASYNRSGHCAKRPCYLAGLKLSRMRKAEERKRAKMERIERALKGNG